jgi:hypothetical protein
MPVLLVRARITNYRSIEDSGKFAIESDVTALVGKNESGKTAGLQALYRVSPVDSSAVFDEVIDFPSRLTRQRKQAANQIPAVAATFRLDDDEIAVIEKDLGAGALASREFTVTTGYRYAVPTFSFQDDEAAIVRHLAAQLDLDLGAHPTVAGASAIAGFLAAVQAIGEPSASVTSMIDRISGWRDQRVRLHLIETYLYPGSRRRLVVAIRAGMSMIRRRRVAQRALRIPAAVAAALARLNAITARASQAALAAYLPEGRCASGPSLSSAMTCSTTAWSR